MIVPNFDFNFLADANRPRPVPNRIRDGAPRRAQMVRNRGARLRATGIVLLKIKCSIFKLFLC